MLWKSGMGSCVGLVTAFDIKIESRCVLPGPIHRSQWRF